MKVDKMENLSNRTARHVAKAMQGKTCKLCLRNIFLICTVVLCLTQGGQAYLGEFDSFNFATDYVRRKLKALNAYESNLAYRLARRLKHVEKANWGAQKTARVFDVMRAGYCTRPQKKARSTKQQKGLCVTTFVGYPGRVHLYTKGKEKVRQALHTLSLSEPVPREDGQPSIRPKPNDFPEWAAKNEDDNVVDESAQSLSLVALR
ncbi:Hypothetical predicted protein [Paramuricea clavata]|uniref:Uncharacterized protein n=1 Tax=Paramuricea clavata TaxID=317549 RepID=A0A7D9HR92_PARCT|nr:Hypothetical predicted protein [Paramuricea clavata]